MNMEMPRFDKMRLYSLLGDVKDFLSRHVWKIVLLLSLQVLAIVLGIRNAFAIADVDAYMSSHMDNVTRFLAGRRNIFAYCLIDLLTTALLFVALYASRRHFLLAYLALSLLAFRAYLFAMRFFLCFLWLGVGGLPYLLLCLLPLFLLYTCLYTALAVWAICQASDRRKYGTCYRTLSMHALLACAIGLAIVALLFGIFSYFLTLGIIS